MGETGYRKDDDTRNAEADTSKQHLTARHVGSNLELGKAQFDKRVSPSPQKRSGKGHEGSPNRTLEDTLLCHIGCKDKCFGTNFTNKHEKINKFAQIRVIRA